MKFEVVENLRTFTNGLQRKPTPISIFLTNSKPIVSVSPSVHGRPCSGVLQCFAVAVMALRWKWYFFTSERKQLLEFRILFQRFRVFAESCQWGFAEPKMREFWRWRSGSSETSTRIGVQATITVWHFFYRMGDRWFARTWAHVSCRCKLELR